MNYQQASGPCTARRIAQSLWQGERYFLQIDSHMRLRNNWDAYLIQLLEDTRTAEIPKPVLTTYPLGYTLPNKVPNDIRATLLVPSRFDGDGLLRQVGRILLLPDGYSKALPSPLWASGFSFSDSSLILDVPYDPLLPGLFFGEEVSMAVRMYTHGYSTFAPPTGVIYHLWTRAHRPTFKAETASPEIAESKKSSQQRVRNLLTKGEMQYQETKRLGLGSERRIEDFEIFTGVNFKDRIVNEGAYKAVEALRMLSDTVTFASDASIGDVSLAVDILPNMSKAALSLVGDFLGRP